MASNYNLVKSWRKRNPEKVREQARRRYAKKPEKSSEASKRYRDKHGARLRPLEAAKAREKRKNDPEGQKIRMARFKAKKELEREIIAGRPRPEKCEICSGNHHNGIVFDHCHSSGSFRGWICDRCNKVLGLVKDDIVVLERMINYLKGFNVKIDDKTKKQDSNEGIRWPKQVISNQRLQSCQSSPLDGQ